MTEETPIQETRRKLTERIPKIEVAPSSLFGRHNYPTEQIMLQMFMRSVDRTIALVRPLAIGLPIPLEKLPFEFRRKKVIEHLGKAKDVLKEMGV